MATITLTSEEYAALVADRDALRGECDELRGEVRTLKVEVSLLEERLKAHLRKLFDAKSEARGSEQQDMFFNEVEMLAPAGTPVAEETTVEVDVPAHKRKKRGRKPLDPNLPRDIVRHELPESERICAHDGVALVEIGVEISEQLDIIPQQVRVIQHHRVKYACPCCDQGIKVTPAAARIIRSQGVMGMTKKSFAQRTITSQPHYGETVDVVAVCTPRVIGQLKDYIEGWTEPKEEWE